MTKIKQLFEQIYLHHGNEDELLYLLENEAANSTFDIAQEFYFAMEDENIGIVVPKIYWHKHKALYPKKMLVVDNFLSMVGYQFDNSYYELDHDDYDNRQFMIDNGFVENMDLLKIQK